MIYKKQKDYDNFHCIADKCPKSCCIGWQIMIDNESLDKYKNIEGKFARRIKSSVNYDESSFYQDNTRCKMLNSSGLCDLQSTMGESFLCNTCRIYPRYIEEFENIREYTLSLSCPESVRMLLDSDYDFTITENEDSIKDDHEDFRDFDPVLYKNLNYAREKILHFISSDGIPFQEKLEIIAFIAYNLQGLYDMGDIGSMRKLLDSTFVDSDGISNIKRILSTLHNNPAINSTHVILNYTQMLSSLDILLDMEVIEESWKELILSAKEYWKNHSQDSPEWKYMAGPNCSSGANSDIYSDSSNNPLVLSSLEKVFKSLFFSYFCGSVYDGQIYARAMIAIQSVRWIMMIYLSHLSYRDLKTIIYLYSREVEHSDPNIDLLISFFESDLEIL